MAKINMFSNLLGYGKSPKSSVCPRFDSDKTPTKLRQESDKSPVRHRSESLVSRQSVLDTCAAEKTCNASGARVARELRYVAVLLLLLTLGVGNVWGANPASFAPSNFSGQGTSGTGSAISATVDGVTFACDKGCGTTQIRCYSGGKITISSSNTITAISFTFSGSYTGGLETSYTDLSTTSWEKTLSSQARITACSVTYTAGCTGTKLGTPVVTATASDRQIVLTWPNVANASGYQLKWNGGEWASATSPVTKTSLTNGTAYTYQVKAIGNGSTYCDGDASEEADATPNVYYTVTWMNNGSEYTTTSVVSGQKPTFPDSPTSCDAGDGASTTFYGWTTSTWSGKIDDISAKTIYTKASDMPTVTGDGVVYHAVFCKGGGGSVEVNTTNSGVTGSYADLDFDVDDINFKTTQWMKSTNIQAKKSTTHSLYNTNAFPSNISSIQVIQTGTARAITIHGSNYYDEDEAKEAGETFVEEQITSPSTNLDMTFNFTGKSFKYFYLSTPGNAVYMNQIIINYGSAASKYMTSCCTSLGSINGSINLSQLATPDPTKLKASWKMTSTTGLADNGIIIKAYKASDNSLVHTSSALSKTATAYEITGLQPCTEYYATLTTIRGNDASYCEGTEQGKSVSNVSTIGYALALKDEDGIPMDGETEMGLYGIDDNLTNACAGSTITLEQTNGDGYRFVDWDVYKTGDASTKVTVSESAGVYTFTMQAYDVTVSALYVAETSPSLSVLDNEDMPVSTIAFGNQEKNVNSEAKSIFLYGENLSGDVAWSLSGADKDYFAVTPASPITQSAAGDIQEMEITFTPNDARDFSATLTFTSTGATDKVIALTGTGVNLYTVTYNAGTGTCETASAKQTSVDGEVTLSTPTLSDGLVSAGWSFAGWKKESAVTSITTAEPTLLTGTYTPTADETLYAVYKFTEGDGNYELVESDLGTAWAGDYLIAYSSTVFADGRVGGQEADGSIGKAGVNVNPSTNLNGKIIASSWGDTYNVTLEEITSGSNTYVLKTKDGKYNYRTANNNGLDVTENRSTAEVHPLTITYNSSSDIDIAISEGAVFHYNTDSKGYFRFYKDGGQNAVYLYKKGSPSYSYFSNPSDKVTITYDANGGENAPGAQENITISSDPTVAAAGTMEKAGHTFSKWNTKADGTGTDYAAGATIEGIKKDLTLYAVWTVNTHKVSVASVENGTITATPAGASAIAEGANNAVVAYGMVVTLAQTNDANYTFGSWTVTKDGDEGTVVPVSEGTFTMPDYDVVVSANFTENAKRDVVFYSNGVQVGARVTTYVGEAPASAPTAVYESCLEGSNEFYGWATEEWTGAINATALAGKTVYTGALPNVAAGEGDVEYYAVWAKGTSTPTNSYAKITSGLEEDNYVIAYSYNNGEQIVLKNTEHASPADGKLAGYSLALSGAKYSNPDNAYVWTLKAQNDGSYYIYNAAVEKYVNATTTAATLSDTPTKFTLEYNSSESRWIIKLASNTGYAFHGYVTSSNNTVTDRDFRVSTNPISHNSASKYRIYLYKNEKETSYSEFRTNCCALKPVTGLTVSGVTANSVTLSWTAPASTEGINKLQVVNADNGTVIKDNIEKDATSIEVTGLTECNTFNLKVVSVGEACSSNSNVVSATPFAGAKVVTFKYNDGVTADVVESTTCNVTNVAVPTEPEREGYRFMGWKNGDVLVEGETFTPPAASTTINATWAELYTVHYNFDGVSGAPEDVQYIAGEEVALPTTEPNKGFLAPFKAWSFSTDVTVSEGKFTMPAEDVTITATYDEIEGQWILVTDESTLNEGDYVVIAAAGSNKAMSTTQNNNNRGQADIEKNGTTISAPSDNVQIFTLEEGTADGSWAFKGLNGTQADKYIYPAGGKGNDPKNYLRSKVDKDADASWVLDLDSESATAVGTSATNKTLRYNSSNSIFSAYAPGAQSGIALYQFREGIYYAVNLPSPAPTGGSVMTNKSMAKAGETVTLTYAPSRGYTVETLTVTGATSGEITISPAVEAGVTEYTFTMPAEAVTVSASFEAVPAVEYSLVENADDLAVGMQFLMVGANNTGSYANGIWNSDQFVAVSITTPEENKISISTEEVEEIVLEGESGAWKLIQGGTQRFNKTWSISISESNATIANSEDKVQFNGSSPRFKSYTSSQSAVALYALPYTTFNFVLSGCKTIKVATGYTYTYTIKSTDVPTDVPAGYAFLNKWTDGTNVYGVDDEVVVSAAKTLEPCWKVTPTADVDINDLPATVTEIVVTDNKTLTVDENRTLDNLTVEAGGKVEVAAETHVTNLVIGSTMGGGKSGQITGATNDNLHASGDVYFDLTLGVDITVNATKAANQWHAFTVPFPVDALNGIYDLDGNKLTNEVDYAIMDYHGDIRATGAYGWKKYRGILQPGTFYLMTVNGDIQTYRFKKTATGALVAANSKALYEYASSTGNNDNGWNGVGNPNLFYGQVGQAVQVLNPVSYTYEPFNANEKNFVVGTPFFIQATSDGTMTMSEASGSANYAPARQAAKEIKDVKVTFGNEEYTDKLYISASEDALNEYETGKDLAKMTMTNTPSVAQIFGKAYNTKLCMVHVPMVNDQAEVALELYAPQAGSYTISVPSEREDASLYLTKDGNIIWDLTMSPYEAALDKGQNNGYGIQVRAKVPQIATGIEEPTSDSSLNGRATKVVIDEHVYILRGDKLYDLNGKQVQ